MLAMTKMSQVMTIGIAVQKVKMVKPDYEKKRTSRSSSISDSDSDDDDE